MGNSQSSEAAASGSTAAMRDAVGARQYDVFLSHAGEKKGDFVDCLNAILKNNVGARVRVFMDEHSLEAGDHAWGEIEAAARNARIGTSICSSIIRLATAEAS
jgi:hypothetical protein